ncbi:MAG TPA: adenylate/guanylate cyclase domain-containing protein, partial [Candidatus Udaeobacter sp.]|nr:adenylate/guanylate cyclase domain-containing protein [Candidatus Udaeobacter sp.]
RVGDLLFTTRPAQSARSTVIVGIDEKSYQALLARHGPLSAWPRTLYADALDALRPAAPRVVAVAIFFDAQRPEDGALAEAMRRAGNVIVPVVAQGAKAFDPRPGVAQEFEAFVRPASTLRSAAVDEGLANVTTGRDSVVRRLPLLLRARGEELPSLALTIVARFTRRPVVLDAPAEAGLVHAAGRPIPVAEHDTMLIDFLGPPSDPGGGGPFRIISFVDVLEGRFDPALVRDHIVLLGPTIRGVDEHATPTTGDTRMWGVEILGNAVETVLYQRFLLPAGPAATTLPIGLMALLAALVVAAWRPLPAGLAVAGGLALYGTAAALVFERGLVLDLIYPPAALLISFAAALSSRLVLEQKEQRIVREAMGRYLSPAVSQWVLADPDRLRLGGETREMTVLFSDLRQFTTLAHAVTPATLVALLNTYRSEMADVVFRHDGVLAQYAGDAIEAFWNAPMDQADHARRACLTALDMVAALATLRPQFEARGWAHLDLGVGINTGQMVVGNMGSKDRLIYTAVGDPVNVAARLEGLSKEYGVRIVVGEATVAAEPRTFIYRFLDLVAVKGRSEPLRCFEVMARAGALDAAGERRLARYHEALDLYHARRWADALRLLDELGGEAPADGPIALYRRRTRALLADPPADDWDGVFVAESK